MTCGMLYLCYVQHCLLVAAYACNMQEVFVVCFSSVFIRVFFFILIHLVLLSILVANIWKQSVP